MLEIIGMGIGLLLVIVMAQLVTVGIMFTVMTNEKFMTAYTKKVLKISEKITEEVQEL